MRVVKVLAAAALIGGTVVACTDEGYYGNRTYYGSSTRTQYVYSPGYTYSTYPSSTQYVYGPSYAGYSSSPYSWRADRDRDGVPNYRDRAPDNAYYR